MKVVYLLQCNDVMLLAFSNRLSAGMRALKMFSISETELDRLDVLGICETVNGSILKIIKLEIQE